jgi:hypothetical protein
VHPQTRQRVVHVHYSQGYRGVLTGGADCLSAFPAIRFPICVSKPHREHANLIRTAPARPLVSQPRLRTGP